MRGDEGEVQRTTASAFLLQTLPSRRLEITNRLFIVVFSTLSLVFAAFGVFLLFSREGGTEFSKDYTDECEIGNQCTVRINISANLNHPIAVMYEISGLYQNHFKSMTSRSDRQLLGEYVRFDEMEACRPYRSVNDDPSPNKWILPCGLEAHMMFNDTFEILGLRPLDAPDYPGTGVVIRDLNTMYQAGIKWLESKEEYTSEQLNLRLSHWMDTAAFSKFRRIWGKTAEKGMLKQQIIELSIMSNWDARVFGGRKAVVIAGERSFSESARLLGVLYLVLSSLMLVSSTAVAILKRKQDERV